MHGKQDLKKIALQLEKPYACWNFACIGNMKCERISSKKQINEKFSTLHISNASNHSFQNVSFFVFFFLVFFHSFQFAWGMNASSKRRKELLVTTSRVIGVSWSTCMCYIGNFRLCYITSWSSCALYNVPYTQGIIAFQITIIFIENGVWCVFSSCWRAMLIFSLLFTSCSCEHRILTIKYQCFLRNLLWEWSAHTLIQFHSDSIKYNWKGLLFFHLWTKFAVNITLLK